MDEATPPHSGTAQLIPYKTMCHHQIFYLGHLLSIWARGIIIFTLLTVENFYIKKGEMRFLQQREQQNLSNAVVICI